MKPTNRQIERWRKRLSGGKRPSRAKEYICFGCGQPILDEAVYFVGRDRKPFHQACKPAGAGRTDDRVERWKNRKGDEHEQDRMD